MCKVASKEKIGVFVGNTKHRMVLQRMLGKCCQIESGSPEEIFPRGLDFCIIDRRCLKKYENLIAAQREQAKPLMFPVLGLISRTGVNSVSRYLHTCIDDLILTPLIPEELMTRIENLMRLRKWSINRERPGGIHRKHQSVSGPVPVSDRGGASEKDRDEELDSSGGRYRRVVEDQTDFIVRWKPGFIRTFVNTAYCRAFGISKEDALGTSFISLVAPEHRQQIIQKIDRLSQEHPCETDEHRSFLSDGSIEWQEWTDRALFDDSGQIVEYQSVGRDITGRKQIEEALRRSEERYRLAQQLSRIGTWEWNIITSEVFWSDETLAMWGLKPEDFHGSVDDVLERIHPDDVEQWRKNVRACVEKGGKHSVDFRIVKPDGEIRWIAGYGDTERDEEGNPLRMMGVGMDITERKEEELKRKIGEERFRSLMEHTAEGFYLLELPEPMATDLPLQQQLSILYRSAIVECNNAQARMYGYTKAEEVIGKQVYELHGGIIKLENIAFVTAWIERGYHITGAQSVEFDRYGNTVWFSNNVTGIIEDKRLVRIWGTQTDITEMKRAEEAVVRERNVSNTIVENLPGIFYLFDEQGHFLRFNKVTEKITGYSIEELRSIRPAELFTGESRKKNRRRYS
ncbi:MAG: PAS domain S-box protein [Chitinivibrionales bacterium]|nr:PAS domain S-box protein [Chitinivibrionales bacterium]